MLRDYQEKGLWEILAALPEYKKICYRAPTGGGKTHVISALVADLETRGFSIVLLAHREQIVKQISDRLNLFHVKHGIIAPWAPHTEARVQVASVQTAVRRVLPHADVVICDEAHNIMAKSWTKVITQLNPDYLIGFTATPVRLDGRGLGDMFNLLIQSPDEKELTARKMLLPAKVYVPNPGYKIPKIAITAGDYNMADAAFQLSSMPIFGDCLKSWKKYADGMKTIGFACTIDHAERLKKHMNDNNVISDILHSELSDANRERVLNLFKNGDISVLWTVNMISEGFDLPDAQCAILMRPTRSLSLYRQQVGRVLRPSGEQVHAVILDHACNTMMHGLPDEHIDWQLYKGRKKQDKKNLQLVRVCKRCGYVNVKTATTCAECGFEMIVIRKIREKKKFDLLSYAEVASSNLGDDIPLDAPSWVYRYKNYTYTDLLIEAKKNGRKAGWAYYRAKELQKYNIKIEIPSFNTANTIYNGLKDAKI